jgi:threonine/homoserine/homoserine lactone efflux protein
MDFNFFLKGIIIGFSVAAPVGPIGVLCIRRTLANGRMAGVVSGLGAATADGVYGIIAAFGLTFVSNVLIDQQFLLRLIGGLFLLYLGIKTFRSKVAEKPATEQKSHSLISMYLSTFFLTITNPATILSFVAIFAGLGLANTQADYLSAIIMVLGVLIGSAAWWLLLSGGVSLFRSKFNTKALKVVNIISGLFIISFGILALLSIMPK